MYVPVAIDAGPTISINPRANLHEQIEGGVMKINGGV